MKLPTGTFLFSLLAAGLVTPLHPWAKEKDKETPEKTEVSLDDPELQKKIAAAIAKATDWLKKRQLPDGAFPGLDVSNASTYGGAQGRPYDGRLGLTALALLSLVKAKVPAKDPAIQKGLAWIRACARRPVTTYEAAAICMLVDAVHASMDEKGKKAWERDEKKRKKQKLLEKPKPQIPRGGGLDPGDFASDGECLEQMTQNLLQWQMAHGGWRYGPAFSVGLGDAGDVSVTQYALMGILSAKRMDVPVDPQAIERAAEWLLAQQEREGPAAGRKTGSSGDAPSSYRDRARGFAYLKDGKSEVPPGQVDIHQLVSGTMTCAGAVGFLVCREILSESVLSKRKRNHPLLPRLTQGTHDALAWLDANWAIDTTPGFNRFAQPDAKLYERGYYLYALERVGMLSGMSRIGEGRSWYAEGAKFWVEHQKEDGSWEVSRGRPPISGQDTPYGILFLSKATVKLNYAVGDEE